MEIQETASYTMESMVTSDKDLALDSLRSNRDSIRPPHGSSIQVESLFTAYLEETPALVACQFVILSVVVVGAL